MLVLLQGLAVRRKAREVLAPARTFPGRVVPPVPPLAAEAQHLAKTPLGIVAETTLRKYHFYEP